MRPAQYTVSAANSPMILQVSYTADHVGVVANPTGASTYSVAYTRSPFIGDAAKTWVDMASMTSATATQAGTVNAVTGIKITFEAGTDVVVDITQDGH